MSVIELTWHEPWTIVLFSLYTLALTITMGRTVYECTRRRE